MHLSKGLSVFLTACLLSSMLLSAACQARNRTNEITPSISPSATPATTSAPAADREKLGLHAVDSTGNKNYLVILADFPDVKRTYPVEIITSRTAELLAPYFSAASYNKLQLSSDVAGPYVLPRPVSYYRISARNFEVDPVKLTALVTDVINAADSDVDLGQYDYILVALGAEQADYGMVGLCALPGMFAFQSDKTFKSPSGKAIENVAIFCENAHMGTYIHDTIHMIGGYIGDQRMTPCLYDHDLQMLYPTGDEAVKAVINMGFWDPLSSHFPYDRTLPPAGLSAWTKLRLNWIDPDKIALVRPGETKTIKLDPLSDPASSTLVIRIPVTDTTYYLVENRQIIGSDANCPTSGILITFADDTVYECRHGEAPVKIMDANPSVPYFNDATYDTGKNEKYFDAKNNISIELLKKEGLSYQIQVTYADKTANISK